MRSDGGDTFRGVALRAKEFHYRVDLDRVGRLTADGTASLEPAEEWSPDHLLLAALARCMFQSLRFHAGRAGIEAGGAADVTGRVTKRADDGRYAFVEIVCRLEVELEPEPEDVADLLARAERDCFVGASLTVKPTYRWTVNGVEREPARRS